MTIFQIKLLAAFLMVVDHVGVVFFPKILALRIIGRLSFPLFAWLIGQGEKYTRNFNIYLLRLIIFGLASQPIYYLLFQSLRPNILATLALGLLALRLDKLTDLRLFFTLICATLAQLIDAEYGAYGILVIFLLSKFNFNSIVWWITWIGINLLSLQFSSYQFYALLTPLIIALYNGEQGQKAKWFYFFYPLHIAALFLIKIFIQSRLY